MRDLTTDELDLISGGLYGSETDDIEVTGPPYYPPHFPGYYPPPYVSPPPTSNPPYYGGGGGGGGGNYPSAFNYALDDVADDLAADIGAEIAAKPDADKYEYVAIIWKDVNGILHRTSVDRGNFGNAPLTNVWKEVDFASGGKIISVMHSHPVLVNYGSVQSPNWQASPTAGTLSSGDFDQLMNYGGGGHSSFDATNYRSYLFYNGAVKEYYAFDQDKSKIGAGAQATWAVASKDYGK